MVIMIKNAIIAKFKKNLSQLTFKTKPFTAAHCNKEVFELLNPIIYVFKVVLIVQFVVHLYFKLIS